MKAGASRPKLWMGTLVGRGQGCTGRPWGKGQRPGLSYSSWDGNVHFEASLPSQDSLRMQLHLGCAELPEVTLSRGVNGHAGKWLFLRRAQGSIWPQSHLLPLHWEVLRGVTWGDRC